MKIKAPAVNVKTCFRDALIIIGCLVFLGSTFICVGTVFFTVSRPIINLSYFFVFIFFRGFWSFAACFVLVFLDMVFSISFSGLSGISVLGLVKFIPESGFYGIALFSVFIMTLFFFSFFLYKAFSRVKKQSAIFALFFIIIFSFASKSVFSYSISTVGLPGMLIKKQLGLNVDEFQYKRLFTYKTTFQHMKDQSFLARNVDEDDNKIISIIVESLGYPKSQKLIEYFNNKLSYGTGGRTSAIQMTNFQGSTINGEIRELCSVHTDSLVITQIPDGLSCVPSVLGLRGYATLAFHNNTGRFYDRVLWYPQVGLKYFYDVDYLSNLPYAKKSRVFNAVNDHTVASAIVSLLKLKQKYFVHWLTIDSHGPYLNISNSYLSKSRFDCDKYQVSTEMECNYLKQIDLVFDDVIFLANEIPDAKIIVSGDHSPRFYEAALLSDIESATSGYKSDVVSSFVVSPKVSQ